MTELDVDVTHKPSLARVECQNNQLTSLILGQNKLLEKLNCAHNQLTQLNLNNMISLKELNCFNNQLTALDVSSSPELTTLWLGDNHLTSLNLDNNPKLNVTTYSDIYSGENVYTVTLNPDRTFDLRNLPGNFDVKRVTGWEHGKANGNILTVDEGTNVVYYAYKCRSDILEVSFKLDVTGTGGSTGGSTGGGSTGGGTPGGSTGGSTGGGTTIPPEAGKYQLTVTDGVATVNGSTGAVLNVQPGDTVTLTADTTKFPENEEFGWWEITPYGSVSNTLTGQYQRTATFTMPPENVSARAMSKTAGVSTGGDGGGAAILLVGGAAVAGLVGYGVYSYVSEQQLKALLPEGILVIRGVSALDKELLGTLVAEAKDALETLEKQLVQAQEEYEEATKTAKRSNYICNELFTWADVYDTANHDERRAILQQFIKEIRVRKDYEISITLNASFNQVEQLKSVSIYDGAEIFEEISEKGA